MEKKSDARRPTKSTRNVERRASRLARIFGRDATKDAWLDAIVDPAMLDRSTTTAFQSALAPATRLDGNRAATNTRWNRPAAMGRMKW